MPTIKQLIRNARQPIRNVTKSPALRGCPQRRGTCTRVYFTRTFCSISKRRKG
uniref:Ribosomal protein S12 n=1 Tax=Goodyera foliosa TaxID=798529 RepID=A0A650AZH7_9ASPA|nr:ribosomal protein S12 [Goodyera foliosa]